MAKKECCYRIQYITVEATAIVKLPETGELPVILPDLRLMRENYYRFEQYVPVIILLAHAKLMGKRPEWETKVKSIVVKMKTGNGYSRELEIFVKKSKEKVGFEVTRVEDRRRGIVIQDKPLSEKLAVKLDHKGE